jgi:valyl-tRNA synthetase
MAYEPREVEDKIYTRWLDKNYFHPDPNAGGVPYCITIPPPNITGSLHIGHALNNSILDTMTRWHRMLGDNTLCLPGTDHAGIATQNVVERNLAEDGISRHDIGREKFLERCWEWRKEYGDRIYNQFQKLGLSYDWQRARFTMDESYVDAIYEEFLQWWNRGLIYRGARVVNWCPRCRSAISDIEVNSEERQGHLYHFRYPYADNSGFITIATTRPETMLGDTAVAVNPKDPRYADKIGKMLKLPLTDRNIPLIADNYARIDFGTGAVKVTPAHDLDDFEAGQRHHLQQIVVIGEDGAMTEEAGVNYAGMDRFACREQILKDMESLGLLAGIEDYSIKIPLCDRCKTVLEPLLSEQWFVKMKELAVPAIQVVKDNKVRFYPDRYKRIYLDWMENIRDWCISRQLWWGHRIPVWWTEDGRFTAARSLQHASEILGIPEDQLKQDEDVLDTWFSSALWPHATLGWPRETADLKFWYPTNMMSTAQEILYLWVARMIITGIDFLGAIPFSDIYIHATVLDERGERMSKSKGNGVDPLAMIEKYGADALRFSLLQQAGMNQDIKFSEDRVRIAGQFCNKLWNASRFVMMNLDSALKEEDFHLDFKNMDVLSLTMPDRWILSRLHRTLLSVKIGLSTYNMDAAMRDIYFFLWDDFCDWYLELAKPRLRNSGSDRQSCANVLYYVLESFLRMLHPMMPFITEEIWMELQRFAGENDARETIMFASYPIGDPQYFQEAAEEHMEMVMATVRAIRNMRSDLGIPPSAHLPGAAAPGSRDAAVVLSDNSPTIISLARLNDFVIYDQTPAGTGRWVGSAIDHAEVFLEIGDALDIQKELERIDRDLAAVEKDLEKYRTKLNNPQFIQKAPEAIIEKERGYLIGLGEKKDKLLARRRLFER